MRQGFRFPTLTVAAAALIAVTTALGAVDPAFLALVQRQPGAVAAGEVWRLVTPILVNPEGWQQVAFNLVAGLVVGGLAEQAVPRTAWILLFLAGGVAGHTAGIFWQPTGGGSSVAIAGLFGGLLAFALRRPGLPPQPRIGALACAAGAIALVAVHDIHGPAAFAGLLLGLGLPLPSPSPTLPTPP